MQKFYTFYQVCLWVFLIQGIGLPLLVIATFTIYFRQEKRLKTLQRMVDALAGRSKESSESAPQKRNRRHRASESPLEALPKLQPLNCAQCGAGVILEETRSRCPNCQTTAPLPDDYAMAASLRTRVRKLVRRAVRQWRWAKLLSSRFLARVFFFCIFAEPLVLLLTVIIGSVEFRDSWMDRFVERLGGHGQSAFNVVMFAGFIGVFVGMFTFIYLSGWGAGLRNKLPVAPVLENEPRDRETANCQACGGCIEYDKRAFVTICGYCHVENYRVQFAHWARARGEAAKADATFTLFAALEIINDLFGTFWLIGGIFYVAFLLLILCYGIKYWLSN